MVFKPFTHLARQTFAKTFTHGYAQSVVAASQSSYASSTTPLGPFGSNVTSRLSKSGTFQFQNGLQNGSNAANAPPGAKAGEHSQSGTASNDGGVSAYVAAWPQNPDDENQKIREWRHLQSVKKFGWRSVGEAKDSKGKDAAKVESKDGAILQRGTVTRTRSDSAVDEAKKANNHASDVMASATVDAELADVSSQKESLSASASISAEDDISKASSADQEASEKTETSAPPSTTSPAPSTDGSELKSLTTEATTISDVNLEPHGKHIQELQDAGRLDEIPAVFEAMLRAGVKPTVSSYHALLDAAIHLPTSKHQVVPKALDVYADMLRRKVLPDTSTYATLIELLALRSLDVSAMLRHLEEKRVRFGGVESAGQFMFPSDEAELEILKDDDSLSIAVKLFNASTVVRKERAFPAETYHALLSACAERARTNDMIKIYAHMEARSIVPFGATFPPMIDAFARIGDLSSAVETYNEYKALAISHDNGKSSVLERLDDSVYTALIKAYAICGKPEGATKFFNKVREQLKDQESRLQGLNDVVVPEAFVRFCLQRGALREALDWVEKYPLGTQARSEALGHICRAAADNDEVDIAQTAYEQMPSVDMSTTASMIALQVRVGNVNEAKSTWDTLRTTFEPSVDMVEPTAMFAVALAGTGYVDGALGETRLMFQDIHAQTAHDSLLAAEASEIIDESIEFISRFLSSKGLVMSPVASMDTLRMMVENGGLLSSVARQVLAGMGPEVIAQLSPPDLLLVLQIQASTVGKTFDLADQSDMARFRQLVETVISSGLSVDNQTTPLVNEAFSRIGYSAEAYQFSDVAQRWSQFLQPREPTYTRPGSVLDSPALSQVDAFDPHGITTDYKGSAQISDELEKVNGRGGNQHLQEALSKFRNMRRAGRHPRYITYAKLISATAKMDKLGLASDILAMAKTDIPYLPEHRVTRHGWVSIYDSMIGACLNLGKRELAQQYHQELSNIGAAPTANTFGLYITTLKDNAKSSDEATEAVRIFQQAKSAGVEPSSFLYNALIGKLGKARRIDDCLYYFAEMRGLGIRPTSVTYGTVVNALCRVSDEKFAEDLFDEMESMPNYKPRPAPYNSIMQFFLTTKRDRSKVLAYYERMKAVNIAPTMHTFKLLIDTYATLDPVDMPSAEALLGTMRRTGMRPEAVHYASLVHAKGCVLHDMTSARQTFDEVVADRSFTAQACLYQALFEAMVANHQVTATDEILKDMDSRRISMTPYIANTLIHGWTLEKNIAKAETIYQRVSVPRREPSTYEAMTRAYLSVEDKAGAQAVVREMLSKSYPSAVSNKIVELASGGSHE